MFSITSVQSFTSVKKSFVGKSYIAYSPELWISCNSFCGKFSTSKAWYRQ